MGREVEDYETAARKSAERFKRLIKDDLLGHFKSEYVAVEEYPDRELNRVIDMYGGIDLILKSKTGLRGVASRIQPSNPNYPNKNWRTFTVRYSRESGVDTEYQKRSDAIKNGCLYPCYTLQAYLDENENLLGYALCKTRDLLTLIDRGIFRLKRTGEDQIGQAWFFVVRWRDFKKYGLAIYEVDAVVRSTLTERRPTHDHERPSIS